MKSDSLTDDNISRHTMSTDQLEDESDVPDIIDFKEVSDEFGDHVIITFDDGVKATTHTHGVLTEDVYESCYNALKCTKKGIHWMKNNIWKDRKVSIPQMTETALMLSTVSKLLHSAAREISEVQTERILSND
jgi:hypothetical protein